LVVSVDLLILCLLSAGDADVLFAVAVCEDLVPRLCVHEVRCVLRVQRQDRATVLSVASGMLPLLGQEPLSGKLWIVEPDRVRIWRHWSGIG
jgi:hypothetical protein